MKKTLESVTFCKKNGERVSIPCLFMELRDESEHSLSFDVQNYEVGHQHLWDFLKGFKGNGLNSKIELEYEDQDKHLYRCKDYHMEILQQGWDLNDKEYRMSLARIDLKLGKEVH